MPGCLRMWAVCLCVVAALAFNSLAADEAKPVERVDKRKVVVTARVRLDVENSPSRVEITLAVPASRKHQQKVLDIEYSERPTRTFTSSGNHYARFTLHRPKKGTELVVKSTLEIYQRDLEMLKDGKRRRKDGKQTLNAYLLNEKFVESHDKAIREAAKSLKRKSRIATIEKTFNFVLDKMEFTGFERETAGAVAALEKRRGDANEYADLLAALLRANDIPARVVDGVAIEAKRQPDHTWVEAYHATYGWIPLDPLYRRQRHGPL